MLRALKPFVAAMAFAFATIAPAFGQTAATTIAVLDFDFVDTSGELQDQRAQHDARLRAFGDALRRSLGSAAALEVVALDCGPSPCSARSMTPEALFETAKKAGARLVLYGGVHKVSTLVQWVQAQVVDVEKNLLVDDRHVTFRGDADESWRRCEKYLARQIVERFSGEQSK
ncbi:DUF2380 domain-containing protein [Methylosinus sp. Ce-a6]|uniref:DUF2380 domain-containing protein n=1 Tax=Methylosinus sp. Ce-a6 TaxID=2172005 RepID=UPI00135A7782|nr:DUF2380 domain-containing protein [Methylosinus sp. Ce-a6]